MKNYEDEDEINDDDSTDGVCDHCSETLEKCDCDDIHCSKCEDGMPRKHKHDADPITCVDCRNHMSECECAPSGHYD